jgi:carboxymethylenebutenolidase
MAGQRLAIAAADGGSFSGYLALPPSGSGPAIVLLQEIFGVTAHLRSLADFYAEEGFVTLAPDLFWRIEPGVELTASDAGRRKGLDYLVRFDFERGIDDLAAAVATLRARPECNGKVGALGFGMGGRLAWMAAARCEVQVAVGYYPLGLETLLDQAPSIRRPALFHFAAEDELCPEPTRERIRAAMAANELVESYVYPRVRHGFNNRDDETAFDRFAATFAHSRTLEFVRRAIGPHYDLAALWENHLHWEFVAKDADETMKTMVPEPYVNHVPTMTGGYGFRDLRRFYKHHFIPGTPRDMTSKHISRTIMGDRLVEETVACFTHDVEIDWLLPGVPPTGRYIEVPLVAIVQFRGGKVYNEHIYWDQASVLVQAGLLEAGKLPVAGVESARKMLDQSLPANRLMPRWKESADRD